MSKTAIPWLQGSWEVPKLSLDWLSFEKSGFWPPIMIIWRVVVAWQVCPQRGESDVWFARNQRKAGNESTYTSAVFPFVGPNKPRIAPPCMILYRSTVSLHVDNARKINKGVSNNKKLTSQSSSVLFRRHRQHKISLSGAESRLQQSESTICTLFCQKHWWCSSLWRFSARFVRLELKGRR